MSSTTAAGKDLHRPQGSAEHQHSAHHHELTESLQWNLLPDPPPQHQAVEKAPVSSCQFSRCIREQRADSSLQPHSVYLVQKD